MPALNNLFILDLANNHNGDPEHAARIIEEIASARPTWLAERPSTFPCAIKFQFRNLPDFVHPDYRDTKQARRFIDNDMGIHDYEDLARLAWQNGLQVMVTPFDELSVEKALIVGADYLKVASCSARDWPLLRTVAAARQPTVISTGALTMEDIDNVVSFFEHQDCDFALEHCVPIYPTPDHKLSMGRIRRMVRRFPTHPIGWSTHEDPNNIEAIKVARALGAQLFERHVGIPTEKAPLNKYSSTPQQLTAWWESWKMSGNWVADEPMPRNTLQQLARGVYAERELAEGESISDDSTYLASPVQDNGLWAGECEGALVSRPVLRNAPIQRSDVKPVQGGASNILKHAIHEIKGILNEVSIRLPETFVLELSHHYGPERFRETGTTMISMVNREYCKKILIMLPGQIHPSHYHKIKDETFHILSGEMMSVVGQDKSLLKAGDLATVFPGVFHEFGCSSDQFCVFEEISTQHIVGDSVYADDSINQLTDADRKTKVKNWGRFEIEQKFDK